VIGTVNPEFVRYFADSNEEDIIEAVLAADDNVEELPEDALQDPDSPPFPKVDAAEGYYMWECDDIEHINSSYADDGRLMVYSVPALENGDEHSGADDFSYDDLVWEGEATCVYSREAGLFSSEEPAEEDIKEGDVYDPVLLFHSSEKGGFCTFFIDTDEPFDQYKLGYAQSETEVGEFLDAMYYDKTECEENYDNNDTMGKSYHACVGWLNRKWHDDRSKYTEDKLIENELWEDFDDNVEYAKEQQENV
jgi:hypothetical protein